MLKAIIEAIWQKMFQQENRLGNFSICQEVKIKIIFTLEGSQYKAKGMIPISIML